MHEGSIAQSIVESLYDIEKENNLSSITRVKLRIGIMSGVMVDALLFALDALRNEEEIIKDTVFEIEKVDVKAHCVVCSKDYFYNEDDELMLVCKECGMPLDIIEGKEMEIKEVEGEQ